MSESVPLLRSSSVKKQCSSCHSFFRLLLIHSKGAVLVLFWDFFIAIAQSNALAISVYDHANGSKVEAGLSFTLVVAGYLGDFLISRHRLILAGSYSSFVVLILLFPLVLLHLSTSYQLFIFKILCHTLFVTIGAVRINMLPFNIDQLIGSSSDELTAIMHWHNLGPLVGPILHTSFESQDYYFSHLFWLGKIIVCVAAVLVSHSLFNHYLETTPVNTVNPVKLIVRVLCYARKHKYPENRSALTYWEEEAPSRIDLGKDKYGGPFTEEEVEDVKTVLRLLPLVFIFGLSGTLYGIFAESMNAKLYGCNDPVKGLEVRIIIYIFLLIFILLILRHPKLHKYIPSMLKRIGMGLTLIVLANIIYTVAAFIGNYQFGEIFRCFTVFIQTSLVKRQDWLYFHEITQAIVWYINNVAAVEFILAQSPKSMRGTLIGLWFCLRGLRSYLNFVIFLPFLQYMGPGFPLGRGFYFSLTLAVLSFLVLVLFIFLAKRYKLRVREVEINIHRIAEDHIIRYIEQDEEHRIDYSSSSSDNEEV